ncbi:hypothetical protein DFQ27_006060 [Actinomortierella ambigua]|uniref:BTB domain-containing protein n=1 Tax=Actinomortierella ambigua TaxID=1343610 RepID=A0A9P6Q084_9FUNG|nr:hypothetical protein DFQ27_006060 [Actinomortierella ambigua]
MNISRHNRLQFDFGRFVNSKNQSDIKFVIGRDEAARYGHSQILSARCPYFAAAFQAHWKEASEGIFRKPNIEPEVFDIILQYLYTGEIKAPWDLIPQLIEAAQELQLSDLVSDCEEYACQSITEETVFQIIAMSFCHDLSKLQSKVFEFFDQNAQSLVEIDDLFTLDHDTLVKVLSRDTADLDELTVWKTIVRYAYHRNGYDHKCCPLLQFPKPPGRMIVEVPTASEVSDQEPAIMVGSPACSTDESTLIDYCLGDTPIDSKDVVVVLHEDHFQNLRATIHPLLQTIDFVNLDVIDFARCIEGTGLIPADLCRRMYKHHALPISHPKDFPSPRRPASTLLPRKQLSTLLSWIVEAMTVRPVLKSLFKATVHGFDPKTFHARCDHKGPTLTIVRTSSGVVVGGYNENDWTSSGQYSSATKNFLFQFNPHTNVMARAVLTNGSSTSYGAFNYPK